jgi:hypothetical protein
LGLKNAFRRNFKMVHYAEIDQNNIVLRVFPSGVDEETVNGEEFYNNMFKESGNTFKKADYFTHMGKHSEGGIPFRKNYPGPGFTYDSTRDAFIPPKPHPSWILIEETCCWNAPIPYPEDEQYYEYEWNEDLQKWLNWEEIIAQRNAISENI